MAVPTWTPGQVLTASDVNTWFVPLAAVKTSDTARASTTTLTADPDLTFSVAANSTYFVELVLIYTGASGTNFFQWDFNMPASATYVYSFVYQNSAGTTNVQQQNGGTSAAWANTTGVGNFQSMEIKGTLTTVGTAGTFALTWAQHSSGATNTTLRAGSQMVARRIA